MNLDARQITASDGLGDLIEGCTHEYPDLLDLCRELRRNLGNLFGSDPPRTWRKNEAQRIGTRIDGDSRIFKRGVSANFDPEAHCTTAAPASSCLSAAPGSDWRIRLSPMRNASNPTARR